MLSIAFGYVTRKEVSGRKLGDSDGMSSARGRSERVRKLMAKTIFNCKIALCGLVRRQLNLGRTTDYFPLLMRLLENNDQRAKRTKVTSALVILFAKTLLVVISLITFLAVVITFSNT